jgi:hypothetical protein
MLFAAEQDFVAHAEIFVCQLRPMSTANAGLHEATSWVTAAR